MKSAISPSGHLLNPDYADMVKAMLEEGDEFMLVGGYAVLFHGYLRTPFEFEQIAGTAP